MRWKAETESFPTVPCSWTDAPWVLRYGTATVPISGGMHPKSIPPPAEWVQKAFRRIPL